ncbi:putative TIM-barrel fold metal-dependent hydrolase [Rhizobium sp. BK049]|nr:putative TIM-barrel fold metal-dependent hydrolase [Rhizobium sp. BK049]
MLDLSTLRAIGVHTHAEEPCRCHADDGYDDLQAAMARYFRAPWQHFPVDAERETGYRRYANEEVAEAASRHPDILIPFASIDPARGRMGARKAQRLVADFGIRGFKFHPTMQGFYPMTGCAGRSTRRLRRRAFRRSSTPARPALGRA